MGSIFLKVVLFVTLATSLKGMSMPWGKDAKLAKPFQYNRSSSKEKPSGLLSSVGQVLIRFHQEVISPADGPRSHFYPSSSQYTLEAMRRYGFAMGVVLGCDRLMRENNDPWIYPIIEVAPRECLKSDPLPFLDF